MNSITSRCFIIGRCLSDIEWTNVAIASLIQIAHNLTWEAGCNVKLGLKSCNYSCSLIYIFIVLCQAMFFMLIFEGILIVMNSTPTVAFFLWFHYTIHFKRKFIYYSMWRSRIFYYFFVNFFVRFSLIIYFAFIFLNNW